MNDLQTRLCDILETGLAEHVRLAEESPLRLDAVGDLADALEVVPALVYQWRRQSIRRLLDPLARHRHAHAGCPNDYRAMLGRVGRLSTLGDDRLSEPQLYLLAVERALLWSIRTAVSLDDVPRLRELADIASAAPGLRATDDLDAVVALAGETGPYASLGCRHWMVFQPLTIPADEIPRKYFR